MKISYSIILLCFLLPAFLQAQSEKYPDDFDPLLGNYMLGNNAEIQVICASKNGELQGFNLDWQTRTVEPVLNAEVIPNSPAFDQAAADLNGDMYDEVIVVWEYPDSTISLAIYNQFKVFQTQIGPVGDLHAPEFSSPLHVEVGDFDQDPEKEIVVSYWAKDRTIKIGLYEVDSLITGLTELAHTTGDTLKVDYKVSHKEPWEAPLGGKFPEPVILDKGHDFDIAAGDFDGDRLDEVMLVKNQADHAYWYFHADLTAAPCVDYYHEFSAKVFDYNWTAQQFMSDSQADTIKYSPQWNLDTVDNRYLFAWVSERFVSFSDRLVLKAGNFDNDIGDEAIIGYDIYSEGSYGTRPVHYIARCYISQLLPLNITETGTIYFEDEHSEWWNDYDNTWAADCSYPLSIECFDFDRDGQEEIFACGSKRDRLYEWEKGNNLNLVEKPYILNDKAYDTGTVGNIPNLIGDHCIIVADLDADTSSALFIPEIIELETNRPDLSVTMPFFNICQPTIQDGETENFTLLDDPEGGWQDILELGSASDDFLDSLTAIAFVAADFDGDAIRLGKPRNLLAESVVEPIVILNAPPIHFDVFNDTTYDVCLAYNENKESCLFEAKYVKAQGEEAELTTEVKSDWGVSTSLSYGGGFLGWECKASLETHVDESFNKVKTVSESQTVTLTQTTTWDDRIFATVTDYNFFEYPFYVAGEKRGYILMTLVHPKEPMFFPSQNPGGIGYHIKPAHEVANILSYPDYDSPEDTPGYDQIIAKSVWQSVDDTYRKENKWELDMNKFIANQADTSREFGFKVGAEASGWGFDLKTEGHYNQGQINTHKTTVSEQIFMGAYFGPIDTKLGNLATYKVLPYACWSQNGALVLDYLVDPDTSVSGQSFWQKNYGSYPDPAFNLPWRYEPEKGSQLSDEEERYQTKEITFSPLQLEPGDITHIQAIVHNYSLRDTKTPIKVKFYHGNPDEDGSLIIGTGGETEVETKTYIVTRKSEIAQIWWEVPQDIKSTSRIYAVIDPDNEIDEVHENNNKGWAPLQVIKKTTPVVRPEEEVTPARYTLHQNYPNPFNPSTTIEFTLPKSEFVELEAYNILGEKVANLVSAKLQQGNHTYTFHGKNMASGIYFYQLVAGDFREVKKMILIK